MSFNRDAAQHQINLVIIVPKAFEILDDAQARLAIRNSSVQIVLLAVLVDTEPFEVNHASGAELRLHRAGYIDWRLAADHAELLLAVLDDFELDGDFAGDLDGTAEGDLAIALCQFSSSAFVITSNQGWPEWPDAGRT